MIIVHPYVKYFLFYCLLSWPLSFSVYADENYTVDDGYKSVDATCLDYSQDSGLSPFRGPSLSSGESCSRSRSDQQALEHAEWSYSESNPQFVDSACGVYLADIWHCWYKYTFEVFKNPDNLSERVQWYYIRRKSDSCSENKYLASDGTCRLDSSFSFVTQARQPQKLNGPSQSCPICADAGHPINTGTGNKFKTQHDYTSSVAFGLRFNRTYNSLSTGDDNSTIGSHWHHHYDRSLVIEGNTVKVPRPDGKVYTFTDDGTGNYTADGDINASLSSTSSGYVYIDSADNTETYNATGQLVSITSKAGLVQTLSYDLSASAGGDANPDTLDQVTGPFGRTLTFVYGINGRIASLTDPADAVTQYSYDTNGNLTTVTRPDGTVRTYHYEDTRHIHALTGITDERGTRIETYAYDDQGRAVSSEINGGIERVDVTYNADGSSSVTDTLGHTRTYAFATILDVPRATGITGGPCANCGSIQSAEYDANGNAITTTDYNGNITTYTYNERNLETSRTEAAGTAQARTITTQWHDQYRSPIQIDRPGQQTTYSYNTQGLLLSRTVTDTQSNSSRTTTYSYNTQGLITSIDGPRTDLDDATSYGYNNQGNRVTTTNALGYATQVTAHDAHGRPAELIDANGTVTQLQYDARQRLIARTTAPGTANEATTSYTYDGVGNLTRLTLPDGTGLTYSYDIANRLVSVANDLGNRIDYTLDLMGNRVSEQTKDPSGSLTRQIQRVYDQQNRLQQVIGVGR